MGFIPEKYGDIIAGIYQPDKINSLGPGTPDLEFRHMLDNISPARLSGERDIQDNESAKACLAGLWLHHDYLDESHTISQSITSASGSFWHGIMHRREGDYWNSKYWFRRVDAHPVLSHLGRESGKIITQGDQQELGRIVPGDVWDPVIFVDLCEKYYQTDTPAESVLQELQRLEWQLLFDFCFAQAYAL